MHSSSRQRRTKRGRPEEESGDLPLHSSQRDSAGDVTGVLCSSTMDAGAAASTGRPCVDLKCRPVVLNIGGTIVSTLEDTLLSLPSRFTEWIESDFAGFPRDKNGHPFIDRDPNNFMEILNYLRGYGFSPKSGDLLLLAEDVLYYNLESLKAEIGLNPPSAWHFSRGPGVSADGTEFSTTSILDLCGPEPLSQRQTHTIVFRIDKCELVAVGVVAMDEARMNEQLFHQKGSISYCNTGELVQWCGEERFFTQGSTYSIQSVITVTLRFGTLTAASAVQASPVAGRSGSTGVMRNAEADGNWTQMVRAMAHSTVEQQADSEQEEGEEEEVDGGSGGCLSRVARDTEDPPGAIIIFRNGNTVVHEAHWPAPVPPLQFAASIQGSSVITIVDAVSAEGGTDGDGPQGTTEEVEEEITSELILQSSSAPSFTSRIVVPMPPPPPLQPRNALTSTPAAFTRSPAAQPEFYSLNTLSPRTSSLVTAEPMSFDVDALIEKLLEVRGSKPGKQVQLAENDVKNLALKSREVLLAQPPLLELEAPIKICGDIHGQYYDLIRLFENGGFPPTSNYLFLGDYVDRGKQGLETICLVLAFKLKFPENFFILRGNHECASINRIYGFFDECKRRYNIRLWKAFTDTFNCLPVACIIDDKIFCCHGGLSPELQSMDQIKKISRPCDVADTGLICDLLWSDPEEGLSGWGENDRGVSFTFGQDIVDKFLRKHDFDLICRAHQVVEDGYQFFAKRQLITIFSAPNYCNEFDNCGAVMSVDDELMCCFQILKPAVKKPKFYP